MGFHSTVKLLSEIMVLGILVLSGLPADDLITESTNLRASFHDASVGRETLRKMIFDKSVCVN